MANAVRRVGEKQGIGRARAPSRKSPARVRARKEVPDEVDVVVIGSGIGGLSAASLLAKRYGKRVAVLEAHYAAGGAAHSFTESGFTFDVGPSLFQGLADRGKGANPLAQVLDAVGERLDLIRYTDWKCHLPEGSFLTQVGANQFFDVLADVSGERGKRDWAKLLEMMEGLSDAATALPIAALRADPAVAVTASKYLPSLARNLSNSAKLSGPFSDLLDEAGISDPFVRNWVDLLCFLLSGLPANGTIAAEVAFMFKEWFKADATLEFPRGGSCAIVDALLSALEKGGGSYHLSTRVKEIVTSPSSSKVTGVVTHRNEHVRAREAVISGASVWDTEKLLAEKDRKRFKPRLDQTPQLRSFMHLHAGFDNAHVNPDPHHICLSSWTSLVEPQDLVLISIPSSLDPSLAPKNKHCLHAYTPATEPAEPFKRARTKREYERLKEERATVLWRAVERAVPEFSRDKAEVELVGTPLTHERFLRRENGTYGPGVSARESLLPWPSTPLPGLYICGDSSFPGIGLPAVAGCGLLVANSIGGLRDHLRLLRDIA